MAHDLFISYSFKDKAIADAVCAALEASGIRCWIAPRDIQSGQKWPEAIVNAITSNRLMVLIFSANSNNSKDVANELTLAINSNVIVIPFKIDDIAPKGVLQYYLTNTHWLDAMNPPTAKQIQELVKTVSSFIDIEKKGTADLFVSDKEAADEPIEDEATRAVEEFPIITSQGWFWSSIALLVLWLVFLIWNFYGSVWAHDLWYFNFFLFFILSTLILVPAVYCLRKGIMGDFITRSPEETVDNRWWFLPAFFGFLGGLISWAKYKNTNRRKALNMLAVGILLTPLWTINLFLFQASQEVNISLISRWPTSGEASGVFVCGDTAYIASGKEGLIILDVSDPSSPQKMGSHPLENAKNVVVAEKTAYIIEEGQVSDGKALSDKLIIIDVENPESPVRLGEYSPEDYVHRSLNNLAVEVNTAYLTINNRLIIVDVSTPSEPVKIGEFSYTSNVSSPGITVVGDIAYVQGNQLHVVDIQNPSDPVEIGGFDAGWGSSVDVADDIAYIVGWDQGLTILDVSNPSRPIKLGQFKELVSDYQLPQGISGRQVTLKVSVIGSTAYLTYNFGIDQGTWINIQESGFIALDVSDPGNPKVLDVYSQMDEITSVFAAENLIFATDKTRGLYILSKTGSLN